MKYINDIDTDTAEKFSIGGKARNLFRLKQSGLRVPQWLVIPQEALSSIVPLEIQNQDYISIIEFINSYKIPASFIDEIADQFSSSIYFAVRSSAIDEDGYDFSYAGQFESHLFVTKENLEENIKKVWCSVFSDRVVQYRRNNKLNQKFGIAVIVQEMINAEAAGVAFGINPANGDRRAKIISSVYGLGEGLVSGELDSDNFIFKNNTITAQLADKTELIVFDYENNKGTKKIAVEESKRKKASISEDQIKKIASILDLCNKEYGKPQDIEFAISNNTIYILQTRPITNLHKITDPNGEYILWDNSNIIESYPGVSTPLTFSFISKSYEGAYKLFCEFMGVDEKTIKQNERVFANTLGFMNGYVFYNLKNWYHMLAMLPGYSINARFMEKMMGVKERFDIPETYRLSKAAAWWSIIKMTVKMYLRFLSLPEKRKKFIQLLNTTIAEYKTIDYSNQNANELMNLYLDFERKLLHQWKAPLLNDFFAMIWFGMLQKRCEKYSLNKNPNIHNDLLCGSSDIVSTQPIHRSIAIATSISKDSELKKIFISENEKAIWKKLSENEKFGSIKKEIDHYIVDFGERCVGELKLETVSYTQDPCLFVRVLKSYVETGISTDKTSENIEEQIRTNAEKEMNMALKNNIIKKFLFKRTLHNARELVSSRENLRYERTRAFGIVREIFSAMGKRFYSEGIIEDARDIFYLSKEEIFSFIEGTAITQNLKALIALRKNEFIAYKKQAPPSERFATYGPVYHSNDFFCTDKIEKIEGDLKGIGCCPGRVRAKAMVVLNPNEVSSLNGCILVTSSTDPGWVTLFPSASAIIVERGSLLSHSAIVSREMGIPCIVSVTGLLKTIKSGDEIEMDGSTGEIKIINKLL
ncbi:MAG TPA: PEP/pyruvate-binding domain-containing protein [Saprospiraceae bacterium]|nr:PEP/pyruvate-binding domain-containing protein [Saprospiraceae bacterium]